MKIGADNFVILIKHFLTTYRDYHLQENEGTHTNGRWWDDDEDITKEEDAKIIMGKVKTKGLQGFPGYVY